MPNKVFALKFEGKKGKMRWHNRLMNKQEAKKLRDAIRFEGRRAYLKKFFC